MRKLLIVVMFVLFASFFAIMFLLLGNWLLSMSNFVRPKDIAWLFIGLPITGGLLGLYLCALLFDYLNIEQW